MDFPKQQQAEEEQNQQIVLKKEDLNMSSETIDNIEAPPAPNATSLTEKELEAGVTPEQQDKEFLDNFNDTKGPRFGQHHEATAGEEEEDEIAIWVRSCVSHTDDPSLPSLTLRAVLLGSIWGCFLAIANCIFSFRVNYFIIPSTLSLLISYPMGIFMAAVLPDYTIPYLGLSLNPGPFSVKEHALIYILADAAGGSPYGVDNVIVQSFPQLMNNVNITFWNSLPWILATQFIGYGVAGICRRFLVKPAAMMWPGILPTVVLINSFHTADDPKLSSFKLSRMSFFWIAFVAMLIWEWIPLYLAPATAVVSILCFFSNNRYVKLLGSSSGGEGAGVLALTFDWSIISGQLPLYTPFWAGLNYFGGYVFWSWIITPILNATNPWGVPLGYINQAVNYWGGDNIVSNPNETGTPFPIWNDNNIYTASGQQVSVSVGSLLNADFSLNTTFYDANAPFYLTAAFSIAYLTSFINIAATMSHVALWYGSDVWVQFKEAMSQLENQDEDEFNVLMRAYPDVPDWFYLCFLVFFLALQMISSLLTPFKMPWWSPLFAVVLGTVYIIPVGIIQAISGFQMGLNVLTEFIIGFMTPGDIVGVMAFKSLGYNMVIQSLYLLGDLKQGHYQHIAPRHVFTAQAIGTFIGAILNLATAFWARDALASAFNDPNGDWYIQYSYGTFLSAGGIWGAIGPNAFYGKGSPYFTILLGFAVGFILPFFFWAGNKLWPSPNWENFNIPLQTQQNMTGSNQAFIVVPWLLNIVFNKVVFKYARNWWEKYNFILGIAFDASTGIVILITALIPKFYNYALNPVASPDYYCIEQTWNGTSLQ